LTPPWFGTASSGIIVAVVVHFDEVGDFLRTSGKTHIAAAVMIPRNAAAKLGSVFPTHESERYAPAAVIRQAMESRSFTGVVMFASN
jgi:hypothetical protein